MAIRVLVVEDEVKLAAALRQGLGREHYDVTVAHTGEEGFFQASSAPFDLVVLDVMLPGRNGFEILQALRARDPHTPVLMLTAVDGVEDRVRGLDSGADDYLVKPFAFPELLARLRVLLRRGRLGASSGAPASSPARLVLADLDMDLVVRRATRGARVLELTVKEFDLLAYLLRHARQLVSREMLARDVWQEPARATPLDNVIDVHMTRLRRKVDGDEPVKLIHTVRGVGFVLREGPS